MNDLRAEQLRNIAQDIFFLIVGLALLIAVGAFCAYITYVFGMEGIRILQNLME